MRKLSLHRRPFAIFTGASVSFSTKASAGGCLRRILRVGVRLPAACYGGSAVAMTPAEIRSVLGSPAQSTNAIATLMINGSLRFREVAAL